jgi:hypothetical protein
VKDAHDVRCERSGTKASRCRCHCGGRLHGIEATKHDMRRAHDRELITDDEYADALERIRIRVEAVR